MNILIFLFRLFVSLFRKPKAETTPSVIPTPPNENKPPLFDVSKAKEVIKEKAKEKEKTPIDAILKHFEKLGVEENKKPYRLNIVGERTSYNVTNKYDDKFHIWRYDEKGKLEYFVCDATTKSGLHYTVKPMNPQGVAILAAGHHANSWRFATHRGKPALRQCKELSVYRDNNGDLKFDLTKSSIAPVNSFINIHYPDNSDNDNKSINRFSAACQVIEKMSDWDKFWDWVELDFKTYNSLFSYTVIESKDLD